MERFYAVASNIQKVKEHPDLCMLDWKEMKSRCNFVNMRQVHFSDKKKAIIFYETIKQKGIIVFKNWI